MTFESLCTQLVTRCYWLSKIIVDDFGETPLHAAAKNGNLSVVRLLLTHGANMNAKNSKGITPLIFAAERGNSTLFQI